MGVEGKISAIRFRRMLQRSQKNDAPDSNVDTATKFTNVNTANPNHANTNTNTRDTVGKTPNGTDSHSRTTDISGPDKLNAMAPQYNEGRRRKINYWLIASLSVNALFLSVLLTSCPSPRNHLFGDSRDIFSYDTISLESSNEAILGRNNNVNGDDDNHNNYNILKKKKQMQWGLGAIVSTQPCSGHGSYEYSDDDGIVNGDHVHGAGRIRCRCYSCFSGHDCSEIISDCTINFDHGDPKMFEPYWWNNQDLATTVLRGGERMSYFSNTNGICWFLEPALAMEIKLIHQMVGNAITEGREIIVGTGSSQIIHAALYAVSSSLSRESVDVVSMAPFYSSYPSMTDYLQSGLHQWAGDAGTYKNNLMMSSSNKSYIEFVTSPGNPDGMTHTPVVKLMKGRPGAVIYDLAYYWPQYTPIAHAADHDIMLFTLSKSTGYAGTRIGWALVRDAEIAKKMTKYIELNTIGVSKDSQLRASQVLKAIRRTYTTLPDHNMENVVKEGVSDLDEAGLFDFGYIEMESRWGRLRAAINESECFTISSFPSSHCNFFRKETTIHPAFAWLKCEKDVDCHGVFKSNGILTRSGIHFGSSRQYVRISMVDHAKVFQLFITRLQRMSFSLSCGCN